MWVDGCMDIWIYGYTRVCKQRTPLLLPLVRPHYDLTRKSDREMDRNVIVLPCSLNLLLPLLSRCVLLVFVWKFGSLFTFSIRFYISIQNRYEILHGRVHSRTFLFLMIFASSFAHLLLRY